MATIEIWSQHSEPQVPAASNDAQDELATLYGALWPRLLNRVRFKWRIRGEVAEDLVHDAWVRAIEHYDRFDRDRPFEPWALRILDNVVIDHLRRTRTGDGQPRQLPVDFDDIRLDLPAGERHDVDRVGDRDMLSKAMATLPPRQQATAVGVLVDGLSLDETAARMELSNTACRQLLHRARVGLRRALLDQGMLPGFLPGFWLRQRWAAFARRIGATESSAVAGSTATVVALAITVTVTLGAGDAIARASADLGQARDATTVEALRPARATAERNRTATRATQSSNRGLTAARKARGRRAAVPSVPTAAPPLVTAPSATVPVTGSRLHQTPMEDPDYEYGVKVSSPAHGRVRASAMASVRGKHEYNGPVESAVGASACQAASAAPGGFCTKHSD